jgi:hypothetical protein
MLRATCRCLLATFLIAAVPAAVRAAGQATVRGADVVNVREAPSLDAPAFYSLEKGRVVTVEKVVGDWAMVTLESGRQGYVRSLYLALPQGIEVLPGPAGTVSPQVRATGTTTPRGRATLPPTAAPRATLTASATAGTSTGQPTETQMPAGTPPAEQPPPTEGGGEELKEDLAELRKRLAALESAVVATPGAGSEGTPRIPGAAHPGGPHEGNRPFLVPTVAELPDAQDFGPSMATAGVGLVIGFLLGAAYGRRQERNRRSRVRF